MNTKSLMTPVTCIKTPIMHINESIEVKYLHDSQSDKNIKPDSGKISNEDV